MALYRGQNFNPYNNYIISASGTSANQVVVQPAANTGAIAKDLLVYNSTTAVAYVAWGTTSQTATSSNVAVAPGAIMTFDMGGPQTNVAVLLASSTGSVYISIGTGT